MILPRIGSGWLSSVRLARLLCLLLIATLAGLPPAASAQGDLLERARAHLADGNASEAFALLSPLEAERAGQPDFDYLLGIAALDSGHATHAVFALERVVAMEPDNALARAELARAYTALREFDAAREQLERARAAEVPPAARRNLESYLTAVDTAIARRDTQFTGYLSASVGYDDNVNSATDERALAIPAFGGAIARLSANATGTGDAFGVIAGGAMVRHRLRPDVSLLGGLNFNHKLLRDEDMFETTSLSGYGGVDVRSGDYTYSGAVQGEHFRLDSDSYRNVLGVLGQVRRPIGDVALVSVFATAQSLEYPSQDIRNANRYTLGAGYTHDLGGLYSTIVFAGAYVGTERERASNVGHLGHDFIGARAGVSLDVSRQVNLSLLGTLEQRSYGGADPLFLRDRDDTRLGARIAINYEPITDLTISPVLEYTKNNSDIAVNDYSRTVVGVTIRHDFR